MLQRLAIALCLLPAVARADDVASSPIPTVLAPATTPTVEIVPRDEGNWDAGVFAEPSYTAALIGHVARGARIALRGQVQVAGTPYCSEGLYYALRPNGFLCADDGVPSRDPPTQKAAVSVKDDHLLPFDYAMVQIKEEETTPLWGSVSDIVNYESPLRMLGRGDTLAVLPETMRVDGERYRETIDGTLVSADHTFVMQRFSQWQGTPITSDTHLPFGWVTSRHAAVFDAPRGKRIDELPRRQRVDILGDHMEGNKRWLMIGEGRFVAASAINEVRAIERPAETLQHRQWIDVDLAEQVLVAYEGDKPVYATMTSSGRPPNRTPRGNYPIWAKAYAITMRSQPYDDKPFVVDRVPWVMFFQAHNALHGAYWHDRFGMVKSHGCANLSPLDARYLFEWLEPHVPAGWTAVRYPDLSVAPVVHVRNSAYRKQLRQDRPIGPPTKEGEEQRLQEAEERRAKADQSVETSTAAQANAVPGAAQSGLQ